MWLFLVLKGVMAMFGGISKNLGGLRVCLFIDLKVASKKMR